MNSHNIPASLKASSSGGTCKICKSQTIVSEFLKMPCCEDCIKKLMTFKTAKDMEAHPNEVRFCAVCGCELCEHEENICDSCNLPERDVVL